MSELLPLKLARPPPIPVEDMMTPSLSPVALPARTRVLVVDDDRMNQVLYASILRKADFEVSVAGDGPEALALTAARPPDLVLLDLMMPEMDGTCVARLMRAQDGMADVPIFLLTASSDEAHIERGFASGVDDYLVKPVDRRILLARVQSSLRARSDRRTVAGTTAMDTAARR